MTSTLQYTPVPASFQPPQTQNTAPVIEHRCLYTRDLRRKAKRWQDGVLRFHTFNKRVMVYDVPRNYIGDTHWREDYPIQDGDEFELDRPVLVQVGEQVGSVDQDLTELFEKRHKKTAVHDDGPGLHSSSPPAPLRSSGPGPSSIVAGKLVPKSLNALLGTPKGRVGRAQLPKKSPYELKVISDGMERIAEPQAKRQRVESTTHHIQPSINRRGLTTTSSDTVAREISHATDQLHDSALQRMSRNGEHLQTSRPLTTNLQLSRSEPTPTTSPKAGGNVSLGSPRMIPPNSSRINVRPALAQVDEACQRHNSKAQQGEERARYSTIGAALPEPPVYPKFFEPSVVINIPSDSETNSPQSTERRSPKTKLQVASGKRRRKLMYRDLLPTDTDLAKEKLKENRSVDSSKERQPQNIRKPRPEQRVEPERRRANEKTVQRRSRESLPSPNNGGPDEVEAPHQNSTLENARPKKRSSNRPVTEIADVSRSPSVRVAEHSIPRAVPTIHDTNAVLAHMDEVLSSRSQVPISDTTKQRSPLKKSNSDTPHVTVADAASDIGKQRSSLQKSNSDTPRVTVSGSVPISAIVKPRSPLQKSNSDPPRITIASPVDNVDKHRSIAGATSAAKEQVISPWSREAWDLFGCGRDGKAVDFATFCMNEGV